MVYSKEPIQRVLFQLSKQLTQPLGQIFQAIAEKLEQSHESLQTIWTDIVNKKWSLTAMSHKEKEIMIQFGQSLGVHNLDQQQKQIHLAKLHLQRELSDATDDERKFASLFRTLGFLTGLLLMLIFI